MATRRPADPIEPSLVAPDGRPLLPAVLVVNQHGGRQHTRTEYRLLVRDRQAWFLANGVDQDGQLAVLVESQRRTEPCRGSTELATERKQSEVAR
jgi:hypothetical protein